MDIDVNVDTRGPITDGRAERAAHDYTEEIIQRTGDHGVNLVRSRLHEVLRNPTGYYESNIQTDRRADEVSVNDGGVIYGPWLEGVGSRNRTTRFKGYFTFRRTTQDIEDSVEDIAEELWPRYRGRME